MSNKKVVMTVEAARRIQKSTALANDGKVPKNSFAAKAMSIAAKNAQSGGKK